MPRFLDLFAEHGLRATFFVVASDLEREGPRRVAEQVVAAGHELASHTWSHPYDLIRRSASEIRREIERAEGPLAELRGRPVAGFRAPGYNLSTAVLEILAERGYSYDSSLFPCPPYYLARAAAIAGMRVVGRRSRSIAGDWRAPFGRRAPHRRLGLVEFPMTVLPGLRLPLIGTSLALMPRVGVFALGPVLKRMAFVNLEFHAVDLLDYADLPGSPLPAHQPDLQRLLGEKKPAYEAALRACSGAENGTLEELAQRF